MQEHRLAVEDEDYPQGFSEAPEDDYDDEDEDTWWEEEEDEDSFSYPPSAPFNNYGDEA